MGITFTETMDKVWTRLIKAGMTKAGAAGMMGNMYAESGIIVNRVEELCLLRLKAAGKHYTHATYTAFVDDGTISRSQFLNPLPGKQYGYGLCQWTSPSRKAGLYDLCRSRSVSIGDLTTQLDYLVQELKTNYYGVWKILISTPEVLTASNRVLIDFESPVDTGTAMRQLRYMYSYQFFDRFSEVVTMTQNEATKRVIEVAEAEIGYLEKASGNSLDSKTGNAGSANYTKYWRDVYPQFQGQAWCACFVSWVMLKAFGLDAAKKLLKHWPYTYCPTLAGMTSNKTPKVGSVIIFYRSGVYAHTGLVVAVSGDLITTIEGNTSGDAGIVANGGGVWRKTYNKASLSTNTKYFMPDYAGILAGVAAPEKVAVPTVSTTETIKSRVGSCTVALGQYVQGTDANPEIKTVQRLLNAKGIKGRDRKKLTVDGVLGDNTAYAIEQLQKKAGMKNINYGTVAARTWELLLK